MKKLLTFLSCFAPLFVLGQELPSTSYTRDFLRSTNAGQARIALQLSDTNVAITITPNPAQFSTNGAILTLVNGVGTNIPSVLNVKELGAIGDGSADDTLVIQSAINKAATIAGDVFFPAGKYKVTASIIVPSNAPTTVLKAITGPMRLFGNGSAASQIISYVTNGATIDATTPVAYSDSVGLKFERIGIIGPYARDRSLTAWNMGVNLGWYNDTVGDFQYKGQNAMFQDVAIDGFGAAITATNVWGLTVDNSTFHSNHLYGLCLSKTHSAIVRNSLIYGIDSATGLTGTGIAFIAPAGTDTSWGFGDTALLENNNILFTTNVIFNNELHLTDIGGNYQFAQTFYKVISGMRTNGGGATLQKWHPWATLNGVIFCDSTNTYHNGNLATARCETDSATAPYITLINFLGDVCNPGIRKEWNVLGVTPSDGNVDSTSGYWTLGTTNRSQPQVIGGKNFSATHNGTNAYTFYTLSNLIATATAGIVTNNASGLTLSGTWSGNVSLVDGASEASLGREGDTTALLDFTFGDYTARQTQTNWQFYLPLVADANGLTNFNRDALAASGAVTNQQSIVAFGAIIANDGGFVGDGQSVTNVQSLQSGTKTIYFSNPNTWTTSQDFAASNATFATISSTGNITVGGDLDMTAASSDLTVGGTGTFGSGLTISNTVTIRGLTNGTTSLWVGPNATTPDLVVFRTNTSTRVGVGTATPTTQLDVSGSIKSSSAINGVYVYSSSTADASAGYGNASLSANGGFWVKSNVIVGASLTANAVVASGASSSNYFAGPTYVFAPSNGVAPANVAQPVGMFLHAAATVTNTYTGLTAATYYSVTNYGEVYTNGFVFDTTTGWGTNLYAGWYSVRMNPTGIADNGETLESEFELNGVGKDSSSGFHTYDTPARGQGVFSEGLYYFPANSYFRWVIKEVEGGTITLNRATLHITTP